MARVSTPFNLFLFRNNNIQRISSSQPHLTRDATIHDHPLDTVSGSRRDTSALSGFDSLRLIGQVVRLA